MSIHRKEESAVSKCLTAYIWTDKESLKSVCTLPILNRKLNMGLGVCCPHYIYVNRRKLKRTSHR